MQLRNQWMPFLVLGLCSLAILLGLELSEASQDEKPYIYYDPVVIVDANVVIIGGPIDVICTKHGRLNWGERWSFTDTKKSYCQRCIHDVLQIYRDKHLGEERR